MQGARHGARDRIRKPQQRLSAGSLKPIPEIRWRTPRFLCAHDCAPILLVVDGTSWQARPTGHQFQSSPTTTGGRDRSPAGSPARCVGACKEISGRDFGPVLRARWRHRRCFAPAAGHQSSSRRASFEPAGLGRHIELDMGEPRDSRRLGTSAGGPVRSAESLPPSLLVLRACQLDPSGSSCAKFDQAETAPSRRGAIGA